MSEDLPLSELPAAAWLIAAVLTVAILATGFIDHESVSVMQEATARDFCPRLDSAGRRLVASMVQETYIQGEPKFHECYYAYRSE